MTSLGYLGTTKKSEANGVSADGSVVVGNSGSEAFRWENGTMTRLTYLYPNSTSSIATGVSADGKVIVGISFQGSIFEPFLWRGGVMTGLGILGAYTFCNIPKLSADGKVVVGTCANFNAKEIMYRWTQNTKMQTIHQWLHNGGLSIPTGFGIFDVSDVSGNGNTVVGRGRDQNNSYQGWLARVGPAK